MLTSIFAAETTTTVTLTPLVVSLVISTIIPILTGLLTKITVPSGVKAVITIVLNAVSALIVSATLADGSAVISQETFITWVLGVVTSIAVYTGVYKPFGVTSSPTPDGAPDPKLSPNSGIDWKQAS